MAQRPHRAERAREYGLRGLSGAASPPAIDEALVLLAYAALGAGAIGGCGATTTTTITLTASAANAPQTSDSPTPSAPKSTVAPASTQRPKTVPRPRIVWDPIPLGPRRKAEMVAYARRHYGSFIKPTYKLIDPHMIVIHYAETPTFQSTYNTFAPDTPEPELHELPNTCAHFVIGHNESLSSPYHREDVPSLRTQTHSDFDHGDMQVYRRSLAAADGCPGAN